MKIKFIASVAILPISICLAGFLWLISSADPAQSGYLFYPLVVSACLLMASLSAGISYYLFSGVQAKNVHLEDSIKEKQSLIARQREWIESLENGITELQAKVTENAAKIKNCADPATIASRSDIPACVVNVEGLIEYINRPFEQLTGYQLSDISGTAAREVLAGPATEESEVLRSRQMSQQSYTGEVLSYKKDGTSFNAVVTYKPVGGEDHSGKCVVYLQDITTEKEAKHRLKVPEQMADNLAEAVFITDREGAIEWVNRSFQKVTGYTSEEVIGRKAASFLRSEFRKPEIGADDYSLTEAVYNYTKSGRGYWSSLSVSPVYTDQGDIEKFIAIESELDVQNEKVQEAESQIQKMWEDQYTRSVELEKREKELTEAIAMCEKIKHDVQDLWLMSDQLDSGVIITDKCGRIEWVNEGFEKVFGCKFSEVAGKLPKFTNPALPSL